MIGAILLVAAGLVALTPIVLFGVVCAQSLHAHMGDDK